MISITPYYRKERGAVVLLIIVDRQTAKTINTGIKVTPDQFKDGRIINHPNQRILNQKIQHKTAELQLQITRAELLGVNLTKDRVKSIVEGNTITTDFYSHCEKWINEKYSNDATRRQMLTELNKVHTYAPSLQFGDIDKRWLMNYERYMKEKLGNKGNTPWKALKFIRTMIYDAETIGGIVLHNPFKERQFKMPKYIQPEKDGLYLVELDKIEKLLDQPHPVIIKIMAARFLFMCYTGLRVSDAKRFTDDHLKDGRLVMKHKKTGVVTKLKVWDRLEKLLGKMEKLPTKSISDQKLNEYLKIIADLLGFTRFELTSHRGRHTFGCLLAEAGVSEEEAMELMGIKNKAVIRVYYRLRQSQMDKASDRLNKLV